MADFPPKSNQAFTRTPAGLANYHLFLNTDKVVFCEGEDSSLGYSDPCSTLDQAWWSVVLEKRLGFDNFTIFPCGSKTQVLANLRLAMQGERETGQSARTFGCVDRDYDDFASDEFEPEVRGRLYVTEGYEVENDLLMVIGAEQILKFLAPRLSKHDQKLGQSCLQKLSRSLGYLRMIDTEFRARELAFLPTHSIPPFIERVKGLDPSCRIPIAEGFRDFKRATLAKNKLSGFADLKARGRVKNLFRDPRIDGFLLCPGGMVVKSIAHVLNLFGRRITHWVKLNDCKLTESLLGILCHDPGAHLAKFRTRSSCSWAADRRGSP